MFHLLAFSSKGDKGEQANVAKGNSRLRKRNSFLRLFWLEVHSPSGGANLAISLLGCWLEVTAKPRSGSQMTPKQNDVTNLMPSQLN